MKIVPEVLESVAQHARSSGPLECCGILLARGPGEPVVHRALPAENAERDHPEDSYLLGHKAHIRAVEMEAGGEARIAGFYHSHPAGTVRPSRRDLRRAVAGTTYLIVGLGEGAVDLAAWRLANGEFVPEPLELESGK